MAPCPADMSFDRREQARPQTREADGPLPPNFRSFLNSILARMPPTPSAYGYARFRTWHLLSLLLSGCGSGGLCSSELLQIAHDPGSGRFAVTERRDCGATVDIATVVRVGTGGENAKDATEVFVADSNHGAATDNSRGAVWMSVVWTDAGKLLVAYASQARVFKREPKARGASIRYKASEPYSLPPVP